MSEFLWQVEFALEPELVELALGFDLARLLSVEHCG